MAKDRGRLDLTKAGKTVDCTADQLRSRSTFYPLARDTREVTDVSEQVSLGSLDPTKLLQRDDPLCPRASKLEDGTPQT